MEEELALFLLSVLKGNILRLLHFLTGQTGRNGADLLVTVQEDERQRESSSSVALSFLGANFFKNF